MTPSNAPDVAVIGCGQWGLNHIRVWSEIGNLRAVCDPDETRLGMVRDSYPRVATHLGLDELLASTNIKMVVVATPPETHEQIAIQAMEAGKHVLVEKPMALTVDAGERMAAVATASRVVLMVGHVLEYHPAFVRLRELVHRGDLGDILYMYSHRLNFGRVRAREDSLWSFAPHDIALIVGMLGESPRSVSCHGSACLRPGVADVSFMNLQFSDNINAHIFVSWLHPFKEHRFVVIGDRQMAVVNDTVPWSDKLTLFPYEVGWKVGTVPVARQAGCSAIPVEEGEPLRLECDEFIRCVQVGAEPAANAARGIAVLRVLDAGSRSMAMTGQSVPVQTLTQPDDSYVHPTAIIDAGAEIGHGTRIWHYSHIMRGAKVGRSCVLGQNCFVGEGVVIGDTVRIQNNVSVYAGVTLERGVFCGPSVVFTNVRNPRAALSRAGKYERTLVQEGASLGANAVIVCGVIVGAHAMVGAGAVVTRDVPPYALVVGVPATVAGWRCLCGEPLTIEPATNVVHCGCGEFYTVKRTLAGIQIHGSAGSGVSETMEVTEGEDGPCRR